MTTYRHVRALERGLEVLEALNRLGTCSVADITLETGIHRTTVHRLLSTLISGGYVSQSTSDDRFFLTRNVAALSEGYPTGSKLSDIAVPVLKRLVKDFTWPCDLSVLDGDKMRVLESTHHLSPVSTHRCMIDSLWPILTTAVGRAYLAYCDEGERRRLLQQISRAGASDDSNLISDGYIRSIIEVTRATGYGSSYREAEDNISAIALPVRPNGKIVGCINVICFASVMRPAELANRYLPQLSEAVSEIERGLEDADLATVPGLPHMSEKLGLVAN
ncbi:MAG: helix-turn-helix domain-containing protein [Pseudomonadota bacterium]|nr:helix-turn-helix domain-containing protein [Pseudomonadota bacterium]MEE2859673.1 helix-turn-helix domain-containing protein [Pseudomonadota bacterium]